MKLEDEIKQTKPFGSEVQKLLLNISFTSSWLISKITSHLRQFDLTHHQFNVLRILKGKYPDSYSNQDITERMIDKSSNATRIVDKLVKKELVTRTPNSTDRRQVDISITEKGLDLIKTVDLSISELEAPYININTEKAKLMNEWLDELRS